MEWVIELHTHTLARTHALFHKVEAAPVKAKILLENISRKHYGQRKSIHETLKALTKGAAIM